MIMHRMIVTVALAISLFLALTQPIYYTKALNKEDIQNLIIPNLNLNDQLYMQFNEMAANPNKGHDEIIKVLEPLCESQNILINTLCSVLDTEPGKMLTSEILEGLSNYIQSMPEEEQERMQNYIVDQVYTLVNTSGNNFMKDDQRNILAVIISLRENNEILLMTIVLFFCVFMPTIKVINFAIYPFSKFLKFVKWIPAKFSMLEVFVVSVIILSIQNIPLIKVQVGYVAVISYALFAVTAIIADKAFAINSD